jgi:alkylation response protein AidB-like acyl-CoA dehydrogenase
MEFRLGASSEARRAEVRSFLDEHMSLELEERGYRTGVSHDDAFTRALVARGWLAPSWPAEFGGQGLDPEEMVAVGEELRLADAPMYGIGTTMMVAAVIQAVGTDGQKSEIIPKALAGEIVIVLGFSEPEAGSDVAAATTRAVPDGDEWVVNGQKMFTTNAQIGDYVFLLTRTDTGVAKHRGLTMFLVPLDQPGVEIQAVFTLSGERTNIVYYNDVRVADAWRIGEVDGGWHAMTVALTDEHAAGFAAAIDRLLAATESWARTATDYDGVPRLEDPTVREALARAAISLEVSRLLQRRVAWMAGTGQETVAEGPMSKLFSSEALKARAQELVEVVGPDALRSYFDPSAPSHGVIEHMLRHSVGTTIYAGTSEIHRDLIAQRGLGLPRAR